MDNSYNLSSIFSYSGFISLSEIRDWFKDYFNNFGL